MPSHDKDNGGECVEEVFMDRLRKCRRMGKERIAFPWWKRSHFSAAMIFNGQKSLVGIWGWLDRVLAQVPQIKVRLVGIADLVKLHLPLAQDTGVMRERVHSNELRHLDAPGNGALEKAKDRQSGRQKLLLARHKWATTMPEERTIPKFIHCLGSPNAFWHPIKGTIKESVFVSRGIFTSSSFLQRLLQVMTLKRESRMSSMSTFTMLSLVTMSKLCIETWLEDDGNASTRLSSNLPARFYQFSTGIHIKRGFSQDGSSRMQPRSIMVIKKGAFSLKPRLGYPLG